MISIADESSAGWDTVKGYQQKSFVADEEDGKKIKAAERRAMAKIKAKTGETSQLRQTGSPPTKRLRWNPTPDSRGCFECGKRSNWKKDCPLFKRTRYVLDLIDYNLIIFANPTYGAFRLG